jgi:transcriptional regulator with XRE-family HTH domain
MAKRLGSAVKDRRIALRLTQDEMERRTGYDQGFISRIERNLVKSPSIEVIVRIARALGCSVDELLEDTDLKVASLQPTAVAA